MGRSVLFAISLFFGGGPTLPRDLTKSGDLFGEQFDRGLELVDGVLDHVYFYQRRGNRLVCQWGTRSDAVRLIGGGRDVSRMLGGSYVVAQTL